MLFWGRRLWASCMGGCMPLCGFLLTPPQHPLFLIEHENSISICLPTVALTILDHAVQSLTLNWTLLLFLKTLTVHLGFWLMFLPLHWTSPLTRPQNTHTGVLALALPGLYWGMQDSTYTHARPALPTGSTWNSELTSTCSSLRWFRISPWSELGAWQFQTI